jgi:Cd2+/Zn2+-exporting ATPase
MRRFQFDANCLMLFAALGAIALQDYAEAAAVVFLFSISEWLEVRATSRARQALSSIVRLRPDKANIVHPSTKELIVVPASAVPVGALLSVKTGDKIPCDGIVVEGRSVVDESSLTGESRPIQKIPGDEVAGGTVNTGNCQLMVRTTKTADNSAVARLIRLVEEAQANRSETEKIVGKCSRLSFSILYRSVLTPN